MTKSDFKKTVLRMTVRKAIKAIKADPERNIRNYIELGNEISAGRFQKYFFEIIAKMLKNDKSEYYSLAKRAINDVDSYVLENFGINVGYGSCTYGADTIRKNEEAFGFNIPFALTLEYDGTSDTPFIDKIGQIISEAKDLGIYTYIILCKNEINDRLLMKIKENSECAFILFANGEYLYEKAINNLSLQKNIMVSVAADNNCKTACELLFENKMLFAVHFEYNNNNYTSILSGNKLEFAKIVKCVFTFFRDSEKCNESVYEQIRLYTKQTRESQKYPLLLMDMHSDMIFIDEIISSQPCSVAIDRDLCVSVGYKSFKKSELNLSSHTLKEILEKETKRL